MLLCSGFVCKEVYELFASNTDKQKQLAIQFIKWKISQECILLCAPFINSLDDLKEGEKKNEFRNSSCNFSFFVFKLFNI